jgi:hypothetical protein
MFKRQRHQHVSKILSAFNSDFLRNNRCYFGGGTRIMMELNEYRESLDIEMLCADNAGIVPSEWRSLKIHLGHYLWNHCL